MRGCRTLALFVFLTVVFQCGQALDFTLWQPYAHRSALLPEMSNDADRKILRAKSTGKFSVNGSWRKTVPVSSTGTYRFYVEYLAHDVDLVRRAVVAKMDWRDANHKQTARPDYPVMSEKTADGWNILESTYRVPEQTKAVMIDLIFRWSRTGDVQWRNIAFEPAGVTLPVRNATLATVNFKPANTSGPDENRRLFIPFIEQAARQGADIICLPEGVTVCGTGKTYTEVAEPIPGPSTDFFGKIAKDHHLYIVAGIYEREGDVVYNTAILIDRNGRYMGKYRKAALPREEIEGGITPGESFPVFETDFGKVGIMICWDIQFPEPARRLAANGAEVILLPIWGGNETLMEARAIENQVYVVSSGYSATTRIINHRGETLAETKKNGSIAVQQIDLNQRTQWEWLGDLKSRIPREAPRSRQE
jgi:predicted amidohydrolase